MTALELLQLQLKTVFESNPETREAAANGIGSAVADYVSPGGVGHARQHSVVSTLDHTSVATPGQLLKADANGLPVEAGVIPAQVALDNAVVHLAGDETVTGVKTLSNGLFTSGVAKASGPNGLFAQAREDVNNVFRVLLPTGQSDGHEWAFGGTQVWNGSSVGMMTDAGSFVIWDQTRGAVAAAISPLGQPRFPALAAGIISADAQGKLSGGGSLSDYQLKSEKDANSGYVGRDANGASSVVGLAVGSAGSTDYRLVQLQGGSGSGGGCGVVFNRGGSPVGQLVDYSGNVYHDYEGAYSLRAGYGGTVAFKADATAKAYVPQQTNLAYVATDADGKFVAATTPSATSVGLSNVTNDSQVKRSEMGAASGVATLDAGSKLNTAQLPDLAVVQYLGTVASQVAMLALTGQQGDWCIRSDLGTTWLITGADPTQLSSWTQLSYPTAPVTSVNTKTGAVTLGYGDVGAEASGAVATHAALTTGVHGLGGASQLNVGTTIGTVAAGDDSRLHGNSNDPTTDQKAALAGTSGAPSASNKYVTNDDTQFVRQAGRAGGQGIYGGTAAGEELLLYSTQHATKGKVRLGYYNLTSIFWVDDTDGSTVFNQLGTGWAKLTAGKLGLATPTAADVSAPALSLLTTLGDLPYRGASAWSRLAGPSSGGGYANGNYLLGETCAAGAALAPWWVQVSATPAADTVPLADANGYVNITRLGAGCTPAFGLDSEASAYTYNFGKFGSSLPLYAIANHPNLGFNTYVNSTWKYGKGSSGHYAGLINFDAATGSFNFKTSAVAGNADNNVTLATALTLDKDQNVIVPKCTASQLLATDADKKAVSIPYSVNGGASTIPRLGTDGSLKLTSVQSASPDNLVIDGYCPDANVNTYCQSWRLGFDTNTGYNAYIKSWRQNNGTHFRGVLGVRIGGTDTDVLSWQEDGNVSIPVLTASRQMATDASKNLVSLDAPTPNTKGSDTTLTNASTWYDHISITPAAGTWLCIMDAGAGTSAGASVFTRMLKGASTVVGVPSYHSIAAGKSATFSRSGVATFDGSTTLKVQGNSSLGSSDTVIGDATTQLLMVRLY